MNSVQLVGRLTRDPDVRYTDGGLSIARFSVACDRRFKKDGESNVDFISCIAFDKTAEFTEKYFSQGKKIGLNGRIKTGSYTNKEGIKVYTTDVIVESVEFVESRNNLSEEPVPNQGINRNPDHAIGDGFMNIPDGVEDEGLPFN